MVCGCELRLFGVSSLRKNNQDLKALSLACGAGCIVQCCGIDLYQNSCRNLERYYVSSIKHSVVINLGLLAQKKYEIIYADVDFAVAVVLKAV